jgi:hypothetical protein
MQLNVSGVWMAQNVVTPAPFTENEVFIRFFSTFYRDPYIAFLIYDHAGMHQKSYIRIHWVRGSPYKVILVKIKKLKK